MDQYAERGELVRYLAHVQQNGKVFVPHDLGDHLQGVGRRAKEFAHGFGSSDWAWLAGLWHDLGKYSAEFQQRIKSQSGYDPDAHIEGSTGRPNHSTAGAQYAIDQFGLHGRILAYLIAGHHAGLPDWHADGSRGGALKIRLDDKSHLERTLSQEIPLNILSQPRPKLISTLFGGPAGFALWVRMLFSCLVDADFLDTEAFMDAGRAVDRVNTLAPRDMLPRFNAYMNEQFSNASSTPVNRARAEVLRQCRDKAREAPGLFFLDRSYRWRQDIIKSRLCLGTRRPPRKTAHHLCHSVHQHYRANRQCLPGHLPRWGD